MTGKVYFKRWKYLAHIGRISLHQIPAILESVSWNVPFGYKISGIGMARIQFCRFRPKILRSPARNSRRMWYVGTRAKKLMFELADCLRTRTKKTTTKHFRTSAGVRCPALCYTSIFLGTESVTNSSRSFMRLTVLLIPVSLEFRILTQKM